MLNAGVANVCKTWTTPWTVEFPELPLETAGSINGSAQTGRGREDLTEETSQLSPGGC